MIFAGYKFCNFQGLASTCVSDLLRMTVLMSPESLLAYSIIIPWQQSHINAYGCLPATLNQLYFSLYLLNAVLPASEVLPTDILYMYGTTHTLL